jgi:hypothetical protein
VSALLSNESKPHYPVAVLHAFMTSAVLMFVVATCNFEKLYIKLNNEENSILINIIFDYKPDSYNLWTQIIIRAKIKMVRPPCFEKNYLGSWEKYPLFLNYIQQHGLGKWRSQESLSCSLSSSKLILSDTSSSLALFAQLLSPSVDGSWFFGSCAS